MQELKIEKDSDESHVSNSCFCIISDSIFYIEITRESILLMKRNSKVQTTLFWLQTLMSFLDIGPQLSLNHCLNFFLQSSPRILIRLYVRFPNNVSQYLAPEDPKTDTSKLRISAFSDDLSERSESFFFKNAGPIFSKKSLTRQHFLLGRRSPISNIGF